MKYTAYILAMILLFVTTACGDETPSSAITYTDVALVNSVTDRGTDFTIAGRKDLVTTELHSSAVLKSDGAELTGNCIVIQYTVIDSKTGEINLRNASIISNYDAGAGSSEDIKGWDDDKVTLLSHWTIGKHFIVRVALPYYPEKRRLGLMIDNSTLQDSYPQAYLCHSLQGSIDPGDTFYRNYYVAFDLTDIADAKDWNGLTVYVNDPKLKDKKITIDF